MSEKPTTSLGSARTGGDVDLVDDALHAVAAARAPNRPDLRIGERGVQVAQALMIGPAEISVPLKHMRVDPGNQTPAGDDVDRRLHAIGGNWAGGGDQGDGVAVAQRGGANHAPHGIAPTGRVPNMPWRQVLGWVLVAPSAIWAALRLLGWDGRYPVAQVMAFTPYVAALALIPLLATVLMRQWVAAAVAGVALIALVSCVLPRWLTDSDPLAGANGPQLRVLTANVLAGKADAGEIVRLVTEEKVDVLLLQELTPQFVTKAAAAGLESPAAIQGHISAGRRHRLGDLFAAAVARRRSAG